MNDTNNRWRLEQILQANACSDECSAGLNDNDGRVSETDHRGTLEIRDFGCGRVVYIMNQLYYPGYWLLGCIIQTDPEDFESCLSFSNHDVHANGS